MAFLYKGFFCVSILKLLSKFSVGISTVIMMALLCLNSTHFKLQDFKK